MFWAFLAILAIASAAAVYYLMQEEKKHHKKTSEQRELISHLEGEIIKKEKEIEGLSNRLKGQFSDREKGPYPQDSDFKDPLFTKNKFSNKPKDYGPRPLDSRAQFPPQKNPLSKENPSREQLKNKEEQDLSSQIIELKEQLFSERESFDKEVPVEEPVADKTIKQETLDNKKLMEFQAQLEKMNKDLTLNKEMSNGLKSQYNELERDMERLQQELMSKEEALKKEQILNQQLKEKYTALLKKISDLNPDKTNINSL